MGIMSIMSIEQMTQLSGFLLAMAAMLAAAAAFLFFSFNIPRCWKMIAGRCRKGVGTQERRLRQEKREKGTVTGEGTLPLLTAARANMETETLLLQAEATQPLNRQGTGCQISYGAGDMELIQDIVYMEEM